MGKSYRNVGLSVESLRFKNLYGTVIDVVERLKECDQVEVSFNTLHGMNKWKRRCYEYQAITGNTLRMETGEHYTVVVKSARRSEDFDIAKIDGVDVVAEAVEFAPIQSTTEMTATRKLALRALQLLEEDEDTDVLDLLEVTSKEGADGSGRPESGGDESDT